jgi:hypothetical protein
MSYLTLVPAYGRDYKSGKEVQADWDEGKDFRICDMSSPWDGAYVSKRDTAEDHKPSLKGTTFNIRFKKLTQIKVIKG